MRILLVEDHQDTLEALSRLLKIEGHHICSVTTETAAIQACKNDAFDLLICDIGLPDGNGWDLMKRLRQISATPSIALTGFGMAEGMLASEDNGFAAHVTKPVAFDQLLKTIQAVLDATAPTAPATGHSAE